MRGEETGRRPSHGRLPGDPDRPIPEGTAQVESRISSGGEGEGGAGGPLDQATRTAERATDRARDMLDDARERAERIGDRASDAASRARRQVDESIDHAEERIERRTGAISMIRDYPMVALGLSVGVGFLLAGRHEPGSRSRVMELASSQLRSAVLGGVSAIVAQELNDWLDRHGAGDLLGAFTGSGE